MRILFIAIFLFLLIHAIRIDFVEGTIPQKSNNEQDTACVEETSFITVTSIAGDTIESLFALYPDPKIPFIDRLEAFYSLNPHLQLQKIVAGDKILLPLSNTTQQGCQ